MTTIRFRNMTICLAMAAAIATTTMTTAPSANAQDQGATNQQELIALLESDAPTGDKAMACKRLAVYGGKEAVPALAALLGDPDLTSWARIALEAIPGPEANAALREAIKTQQGRILVGVINSVGVRQDAEAVAALTDKLADADDEVASASAVALGRIGNEQATKTLRDALASAAPGVRSAVAEGCLLCAERLWKDGKATEAVAVYNDVRQSDAPLPRVMEATRGVILASGADGVPLLMEQLRSTDKWFLQVGLGAARELEGDGVTAAIAKEAGAVAPERAAMLLYALADRHDRTALPAVLALAENGDKTVRIAALDALQQLGDASCLDALLKAATENDVDIVETAMATLSALPNEGGLNQSIATRLNNADGKHLAALLDLVGQRQIVATPALVRAIDHADAKVRAAALRALGETVEPADVVVLINRAASPTHAEDAEAAHRALRAACVRMPDREACAKQLTAAMAQSPQAAKVVILETLGAMGGSEALRTIGAAAGGQNAQLQDVSTRLLGEWMETDASPVLIELAQRPNYRYSVRALRGLLRLARQFEMPEQQRAEVCAIALKAAGRDDERRLALEVLERYPCHATLQTAVDAADYPAIREDAIRVALLIAHRVGDSSEVRALLSKVDQQPVELAIVEAHYGAGDNQRDVTGVLEKQAGPWLLVPLPSPSYNVSFGGDPAPGAVKQLKIRYRVNGQEAEAAFAENAPILLAKPK